MTINAHWLFYGHTGMLSGTSVLVILVASTLTNPKLSCTQLVILLPAVISHKIQSAAGVAWGGSQVTKPVNSWAFLRCNPNINSCLLYVPSQSDMTPFLLGKCYQFSQWHSFTNLCVSGAWGWSKTLKHLGYYCIIHNIHKQVNREPQSTRRLKIKLTEWFAWLEVFEEKEW